MDKIIFVTEQYWLQHAEVVKVVDTLFQRDVQCIGVIVNTSPLVEKLWVEPHVHEIDCRVMVNSSGVYPEDCRFESDLSSKTSEEVTENVSE